MEKSLPSYKKEIQRSLFGTVQPGEIPLLSEWLRETDWVCSEYRHMKTTEKAMLSKPAQKTSSGCAGAM
jgi:hypothetical protein